MGKNKWIFIILLNFMIGNSNSSMATSEKQTNSSLYTGEPIALNFQHIKVRAALQLIAELIGINIIASDSVQGSITLELKNIPWDQALDIILKTQNLAKREIGNILWIASAEEIASHEKQDLLAKQQIEKLIPLQSVLIPVNYSKATDIALMLKEKSKTVLSSRGNVSVDLRTNTLWIQDIAERVNEIKMLVKQLDVPIKQVLIAARIVNVDSDFERELGIRFGLPKIIPLNMSSLPGSERMEKTPTNSNDSLQKINFDLPVNNSGLGARTASFGIALARVSNDILLDMELSALEKEGKGEIISTPRLVTANQQAAYIESGEEVPYQESTSSGATNVSFKKAVLSLRVTPQITPDGKIILALQVNQNTRSSSIFNGVPAINTREIDTQVIVNNGETIVLGGVYEQVNARQTVRVPFLGTLPMIGTLFRQKQAIKNRKELLIFVTPTVIQPG